MASASVAIKVPRSVNGKFEAPGPIERGFVALVLFLSTGAAYGTLLGGGRSTQVFDTTSESLPFLRIVWAILYGIGCLLAFGSFKQIRSAAIRNLPIILLLILVPFSSLWSASPDLSFHRGVLLVANSVFGMYIGIRFNCREQLRLLTPIIAISAVLSILFVIALPEYGFSHIDNSGAIRGAFIHKNVLGRIMALGVIAFVVRARDEKDRTKYVWAFLCLCLLLAARSATDIVALLVTVVIVCLFVFCRFRTLLLWFITTLSLIAVALRALGLYGLTASLAGLFGKDPTITGRVPVWIGAGVMILRRFWLGYGFDAFWTGAYGPCKTVWLIARWPAPHAHNCFLDVMLDLGAAGLVLFTAAFALSIKRGVAIARRNSTSQHLWPALCLVFILAAGMADSLIMRTNNLYWIVFIAVSFHLATLASVPGNHQDPGRQ